VMAVVAIAGNEAGRPLSLGEIAQRQGISLSYLEQLFSKLRQQGIVKSVRGPGGGYLMAVPAEELPVAAIISAVEHPNAGAATGNGMDDLTKALWVELDQHVGRFLGSVTVADICADRVPDAATRTGRGDAGLKAAAE